MLELLREARLMLDRNNDILDRMGVSVAGTNATIAKLDDAIGKIQVESHSFPRKAYTADEQRPGLHPKFRDEIPIIV